jgi:hypothetical protein
MTSLYTVMPSWSIDGRLNSLPFFPFPYPCSALHYVETRHL